MQYITKALREKRKWLLALGFYAVTAVAPIQMAIADPNPAITGLETQQQGIVLSAHDGIGGATRERVRFSVSAYTSTIGQTDSTPFNTADGSDLRLAKNQNTIATNQLPLGTRVRILSLEGTAWESLGDQVWVVRDRMNARYQAGHQGKDGFMDLYFGAGDDAYKQALKFGRKELVIEVL